MLNFHLNEFWELEGGMRKDGIFKTGKKNIRSSDSDGKARHGRKYKTSKESNGQEVMHKINIRQLSNFSSLK